MSDEFFTCGYMPRTLPYECCTSAPKFPPYMRYNGNRYIFLFHIYINILDVSIQACVEVYANERER